MKKLLLTFLISLLFSSSSAQSVGDYIKHNDVWYKILYMESDNYNEVAVSRPQNGDFYETVSIDCGSFINDNKRYIICSIDNDAFRNQEMLTSLEIYSKLDGALTLDINRSLFEGCNKLSYFYINLRDAVLNPEYAYMSEDGCIYKKDISMSSKHDPTELYLVPQAKTGTLRLDNPSVINSEAFVNGTMLSNIYINNNQSITGTSYGTLRNLEGFIVEENNTSYSTESGILFSKDKTKVLICSGHPRDSVVLSSYTTEISSYAFGNCEIQNLLVYSPRKIGYHSFSNFKGEIDIKNSNITHENLISCNKYAFEDINGVLTIEGNISDFVTAIEQMNYSSSLYNCILKCSYEYVDKAKSYFKGKVEPIEQFVTIDKVIGFDRISFSLKALSEMGTVKSVFIDNIECNATDGKYLCRELEPATKYTIKIISTDKHGKEHIDTESFTTGNIDINIVNTESQQGALLFDIVVKNRPYSVDNAEIDTDFMLNGEYGVFIYTRNSSTEKKQYKAISQNGEKGTVTVTGLFPDQEYIVQLYYNNNGIDKTFTKQYFKTTPMESELIYKATQTTITIESLKYTNDQSFNPTKIVIVDNNNNEKNLKGYKMEDLFPFTPGGFSGEYPVNMRFYLDDKYSDYIYYVKTSDFDLNPGLRTSPTAISFRPTHAKGDAAVNSYKLILTTTDAYKIKVFDGTFKPNEQLIISGLKPQSGFSYQLITIIATKHNGEQNFYGGIYDSTTKKYTLEPKVNTEKLNLQILQPKNVSATASIVSAETNISDIEQNVGFQWRKFDAPESLPSSEACALIYGGIIEGRINNLQPTSYYNIRAFYKTNNNEYYFTDWVTFDPSDFSYFEPTVHTYAVSDINHNSAQVRGYVIAGTDDIDEQGFEYWPMNNVAKVKSVAGAPEQGVAVTTILAKGQVMTATLTDLEPETTYTCRAFVKTTAGITYGEEQTFSTESDPSGIEAVAIDGKEVKVAGYYDISGRRYDVPQRGMNIIVYTDGTARKVVVK